MPKKTAELYETSGGSVVEALKLIYRSDTSVPESWIARATVTRKKRQSELGKYLREADIEGAKELLGEWEEALRKECFYYGLRVLLEIKRYGRTQY